MKTYKEIAEEDFKVAKALADLGMWNAAGQHFQQSCENLLKSHLENIHKLDATLERTHNLRKLLREIGGYEESFYKTASLIENYFFDTRYPGDDYIDLTEEDISIALNFCTELIEFLSKKC